MTHVSDEFLSALLDGPAAAIGNEQQNISPDAAHVDGCAQCQDRLGVLRGVATAVARPMPPPAAHLREAAVAAALVETGGATATLRRLVSSNRNRSTAAPARARRMSSLSAAAALVVALAVGGFVLSQVGTDTSDDNGTLNSATGGSRKSGAAALTEQADTFAGDPSSGGGAGSDTSKESGSPAAADETSAMRAAGYDAGAIGSYSDIDDVAARANQDLAKSPEEKAEHPYVDAPPCPVPEAQGLEWHASLTYDGAAAYARVLSVTASSRVLQVLAQTDCAELASQEIAPTTPR